MPAPGKLAAKLLGGLTKHWVKKAVGEEVAAEAASAVSEWIGEAGVDAAVDKLGLADMEPIRRAFEDADGCFAAECSDDALVQAIRSAPLAGLPQLQKLARRFGTTYDAPALARALRAQFAQDWPTLTPAQLDRAAEVYVRCLERALPARARQVLPTLHAKLDRMEAGQAAVLAKLDELLARGTPPAAAPQVQTAVDRAVAAQAAQLSTYASGETEREIERLRTAWREGRRAEARQGLAALRRNTAVWFGLEPAVQAKALRLSAAFVVDQDIDEASALADEARALHPGPHDVRLRALIAARGKGPGAGLALLDGLSDDESLEIAASLQVQAGEYEAAERTLERVGTLTADGHRFRALVRIARRDVDGATASIGEALELAPALEAVRAASAQIDYLAGLAPAALPDHLVHWPEPVDWLAIRVDDQSSARRRRAAAAFERLARDRGDAPGERRTFEVWRFACLATDPDAQDEAAAYARDLLGADPLHFSVVPWVQAYGYDVDLAPVEAAHRAAIDAGSVSVPHVVALLSLYLPDRPRDGLDVLDRTRAIFDAAGEHALWTLWRAQLLLAAGDAAGAIRLVEGEEGPGFRIIAARARRAQGEAAADWDDVIAGLDARLAETGDSGLLAQLCEVLAHLARWDGIADRAAEIMAAFPTAEAARMVAVAAHRAGRHGEAADALLAHAGLFPGGRLPPDLRRLKAMALRGAGRYREAINEAEAIARDDPTVPHALAVVHLRSEIGDRAGVVEGTRALVAHPDLGARDAVALCRLVARDDRALAADLWRRATAQPLPDEAVGPAVLLAYRLGLERELGALRDRFAELGARGEAGIEAASLAEVAEMWRAEREREARRGALYREGTVPVHLAAGTRWPLVIAYHVSIGENQRAPDPAHQPALFVRHGGRRVVHGFPEERPDWRLHADVTAVLLAAHLGVLPRVLAAFRPVRIPPELIPALQRMQEQLGAEQPSRLAAIRAVVAAVERGRVAVDRELPDPADALADLVGADWAAAYAAAMRANGCVVDMLPVRHREPLADPPELPPEVDARLLNPRAVVDGLAEHGPLGADEHARACADLGTEGHIVPGRAVPPRGATLYGDGDVLELLAEAGVLEAAATTFRLVTTEAELRRLRDELVAHDRRAEIVRWLEDLISTIRTAIEDGRIEVLPHRALPREDQMDEAPAARSLMRLLVPEDQPGTVVWVDDRYVTGFQSVGASPIVGIVEVLKALVAAGELDRAGYYAALQELRRANARFIPVEGEEIVHHLRQARVGQGGVVETTALATLRRYVAASLLDRGALQRRPDDEIGPNPHGELGYIADLIRAVTDAISEVWAEDPDTAPARADWLLANLWVHPYDAMALPGVEHGGHNPLHMMSVGVGGLLGRAITLDDTPGPDGPSVRARYLDWLEHALLDERFRADPGVVPLVAATLAGVVRRVAEGARNRRERLAAYLFGQRYLASLPGVLREELGRDPALLAGLPMGQRILVSVAGVSFEVDAYWQAAADALSGREGRAEPTDDGTAATFRRVDRPDGALVVRIAHPRLPDPTYVSDPEFPLLLDDLARRAAFLAEHRAWLGDAVAECAAAAKAIESAASVQERVRLLRERRERSSAAIYEQLGERLRGRTISLPALTVSHAEPLVQGIGLDPHVGGGAAFHDMLDAAASGLVAAFGPEEAFTRLAGLPVRMPDAVTDAVRALAPDDQRELMRRLLRDERAPMTRLHLVRLLAQIGTPGSPFHRLARRLAWRALTPDGVEQAAALLAVLGWVEVEVGRRPEVRGWSAAARLATVWAHAHRLNLALTRAGARTDWIRTYFGGAPRPVDPHLFVLDRAYADDVAAHDRVSPGVLVLAALADALGGAPAALADEALRARATTLVSDDPATVVVSEGLYVDVARAENGLGSFLGAERGAGWAPVLAGESAKLSADRLAAVAGRAIEALERTPTELWPWGQLRAVLDDLPPPPDLLDRLRALVGSTDYAGLVAGDPRRGIDVLVYAARLTARLGDGTLGPRLLAAAVPVARALAAAPAGWTTAGALLMEALLWSARAATPIEEDAVGTFADVVAEVVAAWPSVRADVRAFVERLYEVLPAAAAARLAPLVARLRAAS